MIAEITSFQNQLSLPDLAELINQEYEQSEKSFQSALLHAKQAGEYLIEARAKIEAEQGKRKFKSWLDANCKVSRVTAYSYMRLAGGWEEIICKPGFTDGMPYKRAIALLTESTEPDDEPIEGEIIELRTTPVNAPQTGKGERSGLPSQRYDQGNDDTDPAEEWEDTETRHYNTIPLFNRNDLTGPEERLRAKYSKADDNICPSWNELIPLFEPIGQVMEGEAAAKLNLLPVGDRRRKLPAYIVHRPDLGSPFPLLLWTRENAWQYWQQRRDKLVAIAERKPNSIEFTDGLKTDVESLPEVLHPAVEPEEMPREEHPAGVIASASTCEHYTPEWIWKAALEVFCVEEFDLDPSTHDDSPIPCKQRYTREDNGLSQQWEANHLWSNFPYSDVHPETGKKMQVMGTWIEKLIEEYNAGRTKQAMTLVKSDCRPEWFQSLLGECAAFCMLAKAVSFDTPDGPGGSSFFGSVVFYLGEDVEQFHYVFSKFGHVCQVVDPENLGW